MGLVHFVLQLHCGGLTLTLNPNPKPGPIRPPFSFPVQWMAIGLRGLAGALVPRRAAAARISACARAVTPPPPPCVVALAAGLEKTPDDATTGHAVVRGVGGVLLLAND